MIGQTDAPKPANRELSIMPVGWGGEHDIEERSAVSLILPPHPHRTASTFYQS